jgi:hypothetical protein
MMTKILDSLPHIFTENADDYREVHDYLVASENWFEIVDFLNEVEEENWILVPDDIRKVLNMEIESVRQEKRNGILR